LSDGLIANPQLPRHRRFPYAKTGPEQHRKVMEPANNGIDAGNGQASNFSVAERPIAGT
jgi:hypothetical protein